MQLKQRLSRTLEGSLMSCIDAGLSPNQITSVQTRSSDCLKRPTWPDSPDSSHDLCGFEQLSLLLKNCSWGGGLSDSD
ncbi:MAG: hypothetical protein RLZZ137_76 [Cyanobacteriota bacterium]|jgi:hypothetical protein